MSAKDVALPEREERFHAELTTLQRGPSIWSARLNSEQPAPGWFHESMQHKRSLWRLV